MIAVRVGHEVCLLVPWDSLCSDNRKFLSRRFVLSRQYRRSKQLIATIAKAAAREQQWQLSSEALELHARIIEPDHRRRDLNFSKNLKDGITASRAVWKDDAQVRRETWEFNPVPSKNLAGAVITIRPFNTNPNQEKNNHADQ